MRVLQVINSLILAGAERLVFDLIPRLEQRGIRSSLSILQHLDSPLENELRQRGVPFLSASPRGIYSLGHVRHLAEHAAAHDLVHVHLFPAQLFMAMASLRLRR